MLQYYRYKPEYTLSLERDDCDGIEFYMLGTYFGILHPQWWLSTVSYHQTILDQVLMLGLDDGRCMVAAPHREYVQLSNEKWLFICCYLQDSLKYKIHMHYSSADINREPFLYSKFMECIIEFENEVEMKEFARFLQKNECIYDEYMAMNDYDIPSGSGIPQMYNVEAIREQYKEALAVKRIFHYWLKSKG